MINKKLKYRPFRFIAYIIILCLLVICVYAISKEDSSGTVRFYKSKMDSQRGSFENLKNRILMLQKEYKAECIELWVQYPYEDSSFDIGEVEIKLTAEESEWLKNVSITFHPEALSRIIYEDNRILFGVDGNAIALVYTVDSNKPTYMCYPDEYWTWKRKHLEDNWYFFIDRDSKWS